MGVGMIMDAFAVLMGCGVGGFISICYQPKKKGVRPILCTLLTLCLLVVGIVGVLWMFVSPPPLSQPVANAPPAHAVNDPERSVYFGNGCFWHTQYDTVLVEQATRGAFGGRSDAAITSLVGYAGGNFKSLGPQGTACYHGIPGTDYGRLGHGEAVSVAIDPSNAAAQVTALAHMYFDHGFRDVTCRNGELGCVGGSRRQRLDPQDFGPMYRNVIGLPGGMDNATWFPLIAAENAWDMPLVRGAGGPGADEEGEYVVYVYDSRKHPFFRGERLHQFHTNDVIKRPVPRSYTHDLKAVQDSLGRMSGHGCMDPPSSFLSMVWGLVLGAPLGLALGLAARLVEQWRSVRSKAQVEAPRGRVAAVLEEEGSL